MKGFFYRKIPQQVNKFSVIHFNGKKIVGTFAQ